MNTPTPPNAPAASPSVPQLVPAPQLMTAALKAREPILDPILAQKSLVMLYGPRGLGKTHVALGMAWAAASGQSFLKWSAHRPHRVLYVDGEMAAVDMQQRLRDLGSAPETLDFMIADLNPMSGMADLCTTEGQKALIKGWGRKPELLVLDNLASLVGLRGNSPDRWGEVQHFLMTLRRLDVAVLMLHHANKEGEQRGTSQREDVLDVVMALQQPADYTPSQGARFELHFEKARGLRGSDVEPIEVRLDADALGVPRWHWQPLEQSNFDRGVALLRDRLKPLDVAHELGLSKSQVYRIRNKAEAMGLLT